MRITSDLIKAVERKFKGHIVAITPTKIAIKILECKFHKHCYMTCKVDRHHAHNGIYKFHHVCRDLSVEGCAADMLVNL